MEKKGRKEGVERAATGPCCVPHSRLYRSMHEKISFRGREKYGGSGKQRRQNWNIFAYITETGAALLFLPSRQTESYFFGSLPPAALMAFFRAPSWNERAHRLRKMRTAEKGGTGSGDWGAEEVGLPLL